MKNIVITGISSGIGKDATRYLLEHGFSVYGTVRKEEDKQKLLSEFPNNLSVMICDVTDDVAFGNAAEEIKNSLGNEGLTCLINNAGIAVPGPLKELSDEDFFHQMNVNVMAVRKVTNSFLPFLGAVKNYSKTPGRIINISSVSGLFSSPFNGAYCISKHALESMNDVYRRELIPYGIDVIAIEPGPIKTKIWEKNIGQLTKFSHTDYGEILKKSDKIIENSEKGALPVELVSKLILKIINSKKPNTRYIVHKNKFVFKLMSLLGPDRFMDRLIWKTLNNTKDKFRPI